MTEIGVRELKTRASEIIRAMREERARYVVTYRGHPVGTLAPLDEPVAISSGEMAEVWADLLCLGEAIGANWDAPQSSTELLAELRR